MLTIRMQRRGRKGHAQFRVVVQDSRFHPTSGRVVAYVGNYDPHTKTATLNGEKISQYLASGAQPSDRVAKLLSKEAIKLPDWFSPAALKKKEVRNPDKRRSTRPPGAAVPEPKAEVAGEPVRQTQGKPAATEPAEPLEKVVPADETATKSAQTAETEMIPLAGAPTSVELEVPVKETAEPVPKTE